MDKTLAERIEALPDNAVVGVELECTCCHDYLCVTNDLKALLTRAVEAEAKVARLSEALGTISQLEPEADCITHFEQLLQVIIVSKKALARQGGDK